MLEYMSEEEIRLLANKYYEPGKPIDGDWHKIYIDECEKINEKLEDKTKRGPNYTEYNLN